MSRSLEIKIVTSLQDRLSAPLKRIRAVGGQSAESMKQLRDKLKGLENTQKTVNQFRNLSRGVEQTKNNMQTAQAKVDELGRKLKGVEQPTAAMRREFNQAVGASKKLKLEHQTQSQQLQTLRTRLSSAGISTKNLSKDERSLRDRIAQTNTALDQQKTKLGAVAQQQRKLADARRQYERTTATASNLAVTGAAGYASGRRVLGGMSNFMAEGADFDKEMSKVQALTRQEKDSAAMQELREQARQLGATTAFTSTDAAAGQAFLGMAGFTPEAIKAAMPGVLDMALSGDMDLATTADISSNILTGMGLSADQMDRVADVMTGAFTRSNTDIRMLGETMKYAAPVAAQFGVDLETATAMAAKLGDAGIQGSMGGTGIRRILNRMAAPNKAAREALEELGVQVADSEGKMRPITDLLAEIHQKSSQLSEIKQGQIFKAIGGEQGIAAMGILVGSAGDGSLQELQQQLYQAEGEAAKNAATRINNALGDIELLKSAWADVSIEVFTQNNSAIRELIQTVTNMVSAFGAWAQRNPQLLATLIKIIAVVAALMVGLGGIAITVAGVLGPFAMLRYTLTMLGVQGGLTTKAFSFLSKTIFPMVGNALLALGRIAMANPIGMAITIIAMAAFLIYQYWEPIKAFFISLWDTVKYVFNTGIEAISAFLDNWSPIGLVYKAFAEVLDYLGIELPSKFTEFGSMMMSGLVNGIKNMAGSVKDSIVNVGDSAIGWFKEKLGIQSPSRIFMDLGANVSEGAAIGIAQKSAIPANAAAAMAASVLAAGAMSPLMAEDLSAIRFDHRPGLTATASQSQRNMVAANQGNYSAGETNIEIHIHAAPGMAPQDIARAVASELDKRERQNAARSRSSLSDYGN